MKVLSVFVIIFLCSQNVNALEMTAQEFIAIQERNCEQIEYIKDCHEYAKEQLEAVLLRQAKKHAQDKKSDGIEFVTYMEDVD